VTAAVLSVARAAPADRLRSVKSPHQERSQRSLERIDLLEDRTFDDLSIAQIVARARSSVGVFYSRFADKQALLDCLDELYARELMGELGALGDRWRQRERTLEEKVVEATRVLIAFHRERRGLIRALVLHARLHVDGPFGERTRRMQSNPAGLVSSLLEHCDEIGHRDPELAMRFALVQALTTVREHVLFPEGPAAMVNGASGSIPDDTELADLVAASWLAQLGKRAPDRSGSGRSGSDHSGSRRSSRSQEGRRR